MLFMNKKEARSHFLTERNLLSEKEIENYSLKILDQFILSGLSHFTSFHIFLSMRNKKEVQTSFLINYLYKNKKQLFCPKIKDHSLSHYILTPDTKMEINKWGIPEPKGKEPVIQPCIDCIFIPLLAYDKKGNRVGYGKGYYDKFLSNFPLSKKIGLSFFNPINKITDISDWDLTLDYIITPNYFSAFPMDEK